MATLDKKRKLIIRAVIENTIDQLAIVGGTIQLSLPSQGQKHMNVHQNATNKPLEELILRKNKQHENLKKGQSTKDLALRVLSIEASYVQSVLEETLEEVEDSGTCLALHESVSKSRDRNKERNRIGENEKISSEQLGRLQDDIKVAKTAFEEDVKTQTMDIALLKDALLEARRACKGQEIYTEQLQATREFEYTKGMIKKENALVTEMTRLRSEIAHEQRVNMEVESCLRDRHEFLKNLHAHWTAKLRDDVAEKDAELQKLTSERASDKEDYLEYRQRYTESKQFIDKAMEKIHCVEKIKEKKVIQGYSATKIQAWWRMIMVTKCLGPYKKKKKALQKQESNDKKKK